MENHTTSKISYYRCWTIHKGFMDTIPMIENTNVVARNTAPGKLIGSSTNQKTTESIPTTSQVRGEAPIWTI